MATPTAMKHAPSQQGRTPSQSHGAAATPPVSTPFSTSHAHAAFSPLGPRSSPQQFKKSPGNSATLMGHSASSTGIPGGAGGGGGGSSVPVTYDSPAAAAMGALGINGGLDLGALDHVSVSGLGGLGSIGRSDEEEREKRLQTVLTILKRSSGRVSEAGLERLAKSMGLECLWEEGMGGNKARTLIIAGSALALEIVVLNNIVESVSVTFPESQNIILRHVERANQILFDDLKLLPGESPLTKKLDAFSAHLEQLATLDKLSAEPGLNLYEAVAGVYETLDRLFRWDLQKLCEEPGQSGKPKDTLELTAQCSRHGRPAMHESGRLGLSLLYWKEMRLVPPRQPDTAAYAKTKEKTWAILVGCSAMGAQVFQPVRVSDKWLSDAIEKDGGMFGGDRTQPMLDWLEPENTILSSAQPGGESDEKVNSVAGARLPGVVFHAIFDPPVAVPYSVWHHISETVGMVLEPETLVTFDALSFPVEPGSQHDPSELRTISCDKDVYFVPKGSRDDDNAAADVTAAAGSKKHHHTLFVYKPVYGRSVTELPFSHPSQLIDMLPKLRQYAFLSTVLEKTFGTKMASIVQEPPKQSGKTVVTSTIEDEFTAFTMGGDETGKTDRGPGEGLLAATASGDVTFVDVVLTAHPVPRLQVVFPFRDGTADIMLEIGLNAQVRVVSQNVVADESDGSDSGNGSVGRHKGKGRRLDPQDLGRMLEVCEDLGVWCEWIRTRCV
ncbi:hypothetical protein CMQ_3115 [Grosmannia clavigera kw1407]|uniref:Mediator of RNA polymerase II transcription subunit 1 n=1 Tax=Grosmannia clavigera (strain kw1407 / UAMH 11150) TaxID=655863 RepID=F0XGS2_GROCL|nr:uncharacterized protein CMQ_3115 [Grosmannia clavigera kw1407]EFX03186.1 hypothetical protein CMQ_3115 [Grosmannia clavigera kw1407]